MNLFPLSRCASATQIVRPLESTAETQPQLQPGLLRLSAMISQCLAGRIVPLLVQESGAYSVLLFLAEFLESRIAAQGVPGWIEP
jgi:hypothetical protein